MKIVFQNVLWIVMFAAYNYLCLANESVTIGAVFNEDDAQAEIPIRSTIRTKNLVENKLNFKSVFQIVSNSDSFGCSKILCNMTETDEGIAAIFGPESTTTSAIIQSICSYYEIPHIQTSWRPSSMDGSKTELNFFPEAELFAQGIATIVESLHWKSFIIIYENEEGLIRLQEVLKLQTFDKDNKKNTITVKQLPPGLNHRPLLKELKNSSETNIILDCHVDKIMNILEQAKELKLLNLHYSYFLTSLDSHTLDFKALDTAANITTIRLFDPNNEDFINAVRNWELNEFNLRRRITLTPNMIKTETALMHDAILLFLDSANALYVTQEIRTQPISCNSNETWPGGFPIVSYMKVKKPRLTLTGPLQFDENGKRIDFELHLIDIINDKLIGTWFVNNTLKFARSENETEQEQVESLQKVLVKVASRIGEPYLMRREPRYEGEVLTGNAQFEGFSMDLISEIAELLKFKFEFYIVADNQYGRANPKTGEWNGLVRELLDKKSHLAICDLTMTRERREVVDFSVPFMTLGISILYKKAQTKDIDMFAFLDPFSVSIWIYTATLYLTISVILFFISRMAPQDWENPHPCDQNPEELENIWNIKNCLWLTLGSIMAQGCDILPKGVSSRMATSMWWFFSLIMTSSYTANLAAFLTKERMEPTIDGAETLAKQSKIKYGTVDGGATQTFFKNSNYSTYKRMWINMASSKPSVFEENNPAGVARVQTTKNSLYAFLMESTQIDYEVETKCDLKQVGNWLDNKGFGIAMPVNSAYRSAINTAILTLQERGRISELKVKWWKEKRKEPSCGDGAEEEASSALAVANVGGVFIVLGTGVGVAFIIAILEFLWNCRNVSVEQHVSYWEALKVELKFACNVWITKKSTKPEMSETSSSSSGSNDAERKSMARSILHGAGSFLNLNVINKIGSTLQLNEQ